MGSKNGTVKNRLVKNGDLTLPNTGSANIELPPPDSDGEDLVINAFMELMVHNFTFSRAAMIRAGESERDERIDEECGYPKFVTVQNYKNLYERDGIARRVNNIFPDECWAADPDIVESEESKLTKFEKWVRQLDEEMNVFARLHELDQKRGIGHCGIMIMGYDDGEKLDVPLAGVPDSERLDDYTPEGHNLIYLTPLDETQFQIAEFESNESSPRFRKPISYNVTLLDPKFDTPQPTTKLPKMVLNHVHWTRVLHAPSEGLDIFNTPRQKPHHNRLLDIRKVLGGSGEMYWQGALPGLSFETLPELASGTLTPEKKANLKKQIREYFARLRRSFTTTGMTVKSLSPQVASPKDQVTQLMQAIATGIGVPLRYLMGSEVGKLSSAQDSRNMNRRLSHRQNKGVTPVLIRQFFNRLIGVGAGPRPKQYKAEWPDLNTPTDLDRAQIAQKIADALLKFITAGGGVIYDPADFFVDWLGMTPEKAKVRIEAAKVNKLATEPVGATGLGGATSQKNPKPTGTSKAKKTAAKVRPS
jgi:hypothetical protein